MPSRYNRGMPKVSRPTTVINSDKSVKTARILKEMREHSIEEAASQMAQKVGIPYIDLHIFPITTEDLLLVPEERSRADHFVSFHKQGVRVRFAIAAEYASTALPAVTALAKERSWEARVFVASGASIERAQGGYTRKTLLDNLDLVRVNLRDEDLARFEQNFSDLLALKNDSQISTTRSLEIIIAGARKLHASDIHIEPEEAGARLRYRIDGILQEVGILPAGIARLLLSRIKMIGGMRLNIRDRAQDGHFFVTLLDQRVDMRVSIIPGKQGENINMRLLSGEDIVTSADKLGLRGLAYDEVMRAVEKPHGMILNTGPTGSGKTTTLYTLLNKINNPGIKIITVEDPIEYNLSGIIQTEVSKGKQYTFATALRAIVRQDPDVILVGEIRDDETADIAVNAAMTGHLVFSTLHTNSAPGAIPRFLELGVKPSLIGSAINIIVGQRLVRTLCKKCATSYVPAEETVHSLIRLITIISPKAKLSLPTKIETLPKAVGCVECNFTGYKGRIGIFEAMPITSRLRQLIDNIATEDEVLAAALENGMVTMTQDGILKALEGITTLEEVWRVSDQTEMLEEVYAELMPSELTRASIVPEAVLTETKAHLESLADFARYIKSVDSEQRLPVMFAAAIELNAADIHIEPTRDSFIIRFRLDGILEQAASFPLDEYPNFIGKIKLLGNLKSGERAGIVDSRFSLTLEGEDTSTSKNIDVRLSLILGGFGETAELRILNQATLTLDLASLNIREQTLTRLLSAIEKPNGIIFNTGPTGSGKTTTLYAALAKLNQPTVKIITVEDPIEYQLPGLLQTQVNEAEGYTFATALRSLLRQNPDILMIGEIRDDDTAQIAIQAAATGHLVLTTLHANSATSTVSRLAKMGVTNDDLANAANLFMAQRLVRRLCEHCKQKKSPTEAETQNIKSVLASISPKAGVMPTQAICLWEKQGCKECSGTGFSGQVVIAEALPISRTLQDLIARGALAHELEEKAIEEGMLTLTQDGVLAALEGRTTLDEVRRVTEL